MFLEIYVFVYSQELRLRSHYEYFDLLADLNCIEVEESGDQVHSPLSFTPNLAQFTKPKKPTISKLDEAAKELFAELQHK
ncbi:MAG: hypothetical protein K0Q87_3020 [Neobacillus sp.]|jgi:hypothetical protein|nr:hypothetical protein [Neobacillus sp.]